MQRTHFLFLSIIMLIFSCSTTKKPTDLTNTSNSGFEQATTSEDNSEKIGNGELLVGGNSDNNTSGALKTIYFGFNAATIDSQTKETLAANAQFLKDNSQLKIQIQGHCDEGGSSQYNLALGEKRAESVKEYLENLGVKNTISTVSFGKEQPFATGHDEDSWAQNRRANFSITSK